MRKKVYVFGLVIALYVSIIASVVNFLPTVAGGIIFEEDWTWTDDDWTPHDQDGYTGWGSVGSNMIDGDNSMHYIYDGWMEAVRIGSKIANQQNFVRYDPGFDPVLTNHFRWAFLVNETTRTLIGGVNDYLSTNDGIHISSVGGYLRVWNDAYGEQVLNNTMEIIVNTWYILYMNITKDTNWYCDDLKIQALIGDKEEVTGGAMEQLNITPGDRWALQSEPDRFFIGCGDDSMASAASNGLWSDYYLHRNDPISPWESGEEGGESGPFPNYVPTRIQLIEHEDQVQETMFNFTHESNATHDYLSVTSNVTEAKEGYGIVAMVFDSSWLYGKTINVTYSYNMSGTTGSNFSLVIMDEEYNRTSITDFPYQTLMRNQSDRVRQVIDTNNTFGEWAVVNNATLLNFTNVMEEVTIMMWLIDRNVSSAHQLNISLIQIEDTDTGGVLWSFHPDENLIIDYPEGNRTTDENEYGLILYSKQDEDVWFIDPDLWITPPTDDDDGYSTGDFMTVISDWMPLIVMMMLFAMLAGVGKEKKKKKKGFKTITYKDEYA